MKPHEIYDTGDCRPFERRWRNYCVDRGLRDDWLERLNSLQIFDLISICEGHEDEPVAVHRRLPHINLRLKEGRAEVFETKWSSIRNAIGNAIDACFSNRFTKVNFEFRSGFVKDRRSTEPQDIVLLKLTSSVDVLDFERAYYGAVWFEENIAAAEAIDQFMYEHLNDVRHTPE